MWARVSTLTRIRGGWRLTDTKALAVMPRRSSPLAVMMVTPLAKRPSV